jgi:myo-inositol 2-dehydrogenase/D-chiro-inositol 1-dehydrogenase
MRPVPVILVGYGRMGRVHGLSSLRHPDDMEVVAVVDPSDDARRRARADLGDGTAMYTDLNECLCRHEGAACLVVSPTNLHAGAVRAALNAGRSVFCEKPLTLDQAESVALLDLAEHAELILQTGFYRRHSPTWRLARDTLRSGTIGRPVLLRLSQWDAEASAADVLDPDVGGGLIVDFGVHEFDLLLWLTGDSVEHVRSAGRSLDGQPATSARVETCVVVAELSGGGLGVVDLGTGVRYDDDVRGEIAGTLGRIFVETIPHGSVVLGDSGGLRSLELPHSEEPAVFTDAVIREQQAFARAVMCRSTASPDARDSIRAMLIAEAAMKSLDEGGSRVRVPDHPGLAMG